MSKKSQRTFADLRIGESFIFFPESEDVKQTVLWKKQDESVAVSQYNGCDFRPGAADRVIQVQMQQTSPD
jgi:hypothetical protein